MPHPNARVSTSSGSLRLRSAVRDVAAGLRQFWQGYWQAPTSC